MKLFMKDNLSKNIKNIQISGIRQFYNKAADYIGAISFTIGQPDFSVPQRIKEAMISSITENKTRYTSNAGLLELRSQICTYLMSMGIDYKIDEVCITVGGSEALMDSFAAILNTDDKVLVPNPGYPAYESCVSILGGKAVYYNLKDDFSIDFDNLKKIIDDEKPKAIVISYPSNPTGAVMTKYGKDELYKILKGRDIYIITDEMYSSLCFKEYNSIAQMKELKSKMIVIGGFSKMFCMTGLRIGYVCAEKYIMDEIMKVHQYNVSCAPSIAQYGAIEGLKSCQQDVKIMKNEFIKRRDYVFERLNAMGFDVLKPEGAFYMFPSIKKSGMKSNEFCERLLKEAGVAVVPGVAFGSAGEWHVRISYASSINELKNGLNRIEKWINGQHKE